MLHLQTDRTLRIRKILVGVLTLIMLATPSVSQACWLTDWFRRKPQTTYYQPYAASYASASACTTTCTKRVCNYVPQTSYRTVYYNVPVTTYRQMTTANPCAGCQTTCWKPVTSYVQQARQVPYTTYRQVCQNVTTTTPGCGTCNTGYMSQGRSGGYYPTASPGCSSCSSGTLGVPSTQALPQPTWDAAKPMTSAGAPPNTFQNPQQHGTAKPKSVIVPPHTDPAPKKGPDFNVKPTVSPPSNRPIWKHRTASTGQQRTWSYTAVSWPVQQASHTSDMTSSASNHHQTDLDDRGWVSIAE